MGHRQELRRPAASFTVAEHLALGEQAAELVRLAVSAAATDLEGLALEALERRDLGRQLGQGADGVTWSRICSSTVSASVSGASSSSSSSGERSIAAPSRSAAPGPELRSPRSASRRSRRSRRRRSDWLIASDEEASRRPPFA